MSVFFNLLLLGKCPFGKYPFSGICFFWVNVRWVNVCWGFVLGKCPFGKCLFGGKSMNARSVSAGYVLALMPKKCIWPCPLELPIFELDNVHEASSSLLFESVTQIVWQHFFCFHYDSVPHSFPLKWNTPKSDKNCYFTLLEMCSAQG